MAAADLPGADAHDRMERMYRPQKLIYDITRRYYLIGRDRLIDGIDLRPDQLLIDIGCGTGRNLARLAERQPRARLFGIDAADAMLEVAAKRLGDRVTLARGTAEGFDAAALSGSADGFDHATLSYALSMMPDPTAVIDRAMASLRPGGRLHIVDFGDMRGLPHPAAALLRAWLDRFGVHRKPEVEAHLDALAKTGAGRLERERLLGGYAVLLRFERH